MYQVLARKWRPQTFDGLVGQSHVARTLTNAIRSDRLAHAYIFSGLRGTGKTSAARILAKCLDCEQGPTPTPCNECTPCREITEGRAIDILEIDAASRTKVEQTRELLETLSYAPTRDRYKVLIIDEVHMLSKSSFNALLKTLEEPPPRVVFVLATTELHKILPTILSRCQVFEFRRVTPAELSAHLRKLADEEGIVISDASLDRIARYGEGSVRDSLSVLERVIAFCGKDVADEDVLNALGAVRSEVLVRMIESFARRDAGAMLEVLDEVAGEGRDLLHLWAECIGVLRDLQVLRAAPGRQELLTRTPDEARRLADAADGLSAEDLNRAFQILAGLEFGLKSSAHPRYLFEAALIRLASLGAVRPIEEFLGALGATEPSSLPPPGTGPAGRGGPPSHGRPDRAGGPGQGPRGARDPGAGAAPAAVAARTDLPGPNPGDPSLRRNFERAISDAKPLLGGILSHAAAIRMERDEIQVSFAPDGEIWLRQLERDDYRELLRSVAASLCGATDVRVIRTEATPRDGNGTSTGNGGGNGAPSVGIESIRPPSRNELMESAKSDPGVRHLLREFGAQVLDIRPLAPIPIDDGGAEDGGTAEDGR